MCDILWYELLHFIYQPPTWILTSATISSSLSNPTDQVALSENETDNILKIVERRGEKHSPASVIKLRLHSNLKAKIDQRRKSNKNKRNSSDSNNVVPLGKSSSVSEYTDERGSF